jgi:hypothetical protein
VGTQRNSTNAPTLEDVEQEMAQRDQMLKRDQKINEWIKEEQERSRKRDERE